MQKEVVSNSTHTPSPATKNTQKIYFAKQHFVKKVQQPSNDSSSHAKRDHLQALGTNLLTVKSAL
jgi:hypothetical protein